jgi:uncharacterized LabA/DUF88 family protein
MGFSGYSPGIPPEAFEKAMVFVDGTNLFCRLDAAKLKVNPLIALFSRFVGQRQIVRTYLYTVEQRLQKAESIHGSGFCNKIRVIFGTTVQKADGNSKEKGVDALLVADMIYHAASRNCQYALVVTADTDFVHVLNRVEDFGCRTGVLGVCCQTPERLINACDEYHEATKEYLVEHGLAVLTS